jgi:hypothetical protein
LREEEIKHIADVRSKPAPCLCQFGE